MDMAPVDRANLPMLHPSRANGAQWFKHHTQVSTAVRRVIQSYFRGPWYSWKRVPPFFRQALFNLFKGIFNWDPTINGQVESEFNKLAAYRLRGMISNAKRTGVKPDWILSEYWTIMQAYWATPKAKANSEKARNSRLSDRSGLGPHSHISGSRSYAKVQDVLEANNEDYSFIAVMKKANQKPDGTYVDQRAQLVAETYEKLVQEHLTQLEASGQQNVTAENLDQRVKNEIYIKAAAAAPGSSKQGVFGLGGLGEGLPSVNASPSEPQPSEVEMITNRMQEMETELQQSREENQEIQKRLEAMEKMVESFASQIA
uniref:Putative transposase-like protein n=1 Tax=Noccaea caerulescens TaxID=107243 RepID=A0A1J3GEX1_NOCCA